jgi:hypothetical protein
MVRAGIERIAIMPSELKPGESQRASGLIVQEEHHDHLKRGVVTDVGPEVPPIFEPGMTVYYHCGLKVEDVEIVHVSHVEGFSEDA